MAIGRVFSGAHAYARWTPNGLWEDPDDGNDSGTEEMGNEEEEEGTDDAGEMKVSAVKDDKCAVAQYEDLMKGFLLLSLLVFECVYLLLNSFLYLYSVLKSILLFFIMITYLGS